MQIDFTGKTVVVTGAAGGIGVVCARTFLESGARVAAVDVTAVAAGAFLPIPATEALLAAWAAALALLARRVYLQEKWKKS